MCDSQLRADATEKRQNEEDRKERLRERALESIQDQNPNESINEKAREALTEERQKEERLNANLLERAEERLGKTTSDESESE